MKKHDEGYVLAFVMVVITVLCLIAVLLMPLSLRNLEAQNDSIRRMQDKYAAQGVIETVVAKMDSDIEIGDLDDLETVLKSYLGADDEFNLYSPDGIDEDESFTAKVMITAKRGSARVEATLIWYADVTEAGGNYQITPNLLQYEAYQVSSIREVGPDD